MRRPWGHILDAERRPMIPAANDNHALVPLPVFQCAACRLVYPRHQVGAVLRNLLICDVCAHD